MGLKKIKFTMIQESYVQDDKTALTIYKLAPFLHTQKSLKVCKTFKKINHVHIPRIQRSLSANMTDFITGYIYFKNIVISLNFMGGSNHR